MYSLVDVSPSPSSPLRLLVVDGSALFRLGLRLAFRESESPRWIEVVGEAGGVAEALIAARRLRPDMVLTEVRFPDGSGLELCRSLIREFPALPILILSAQSSDPLIHEAVMAGARGYLTKDVEPAALIGAIRDAAGGRSVLSPEVTARVLGLLRSRNAEGGVDLSRLSQQEKRVLALLAEGRTNKEIGGRLKLSENTVKNYLVSVFEKLGVRRRSQAAALFVKHTAPGAN